MCTPQAYVRMSANPEESRRRMSELRTSKRNSRDGSIQAFTRFQTPTNAD